MDNVDIAKRICERYGITWDEKLTVPFFNNVELTPKMLETAFEIENSNGYAYKFTIAYSSNPSFSNYTLKAPGTLVA